MATLPPILVTDTNIWIDLENGKILTDVFHLPYRFFTSDFACHETNFPDWNNLQMLGLQTHDLKPEKVFELFRMRATHHQLSVVDLATLLIAEELGASLITGDRRLNDLAKTRGLVVHGVLWILDEMVKHNVLAPFQATASLKEMLERGARLPNGECQKRFEIWTL
jgi:predicted nucleic acid-binding protein